jgi:hypothetical protein
VNNHLVYDLNLVPLYTEHAGLVIVNCVGDLPSWLCKKFAPCNALHGNIPPCLTERCLLLATVEEILSRNMTNANTAAVDKQIVSVLC